MEEIKMMLRNYLIIGIVLFSGLSCVKKDYLNESEWHFINNTDRTIKVTYGDGSFIACDMDFILSPNQEYAFSISADAIRPDLTVLDYSSPYSIYGATIAVEGAAPIFFPGQNSAGFDGNLYSICDIGGYAAEKLGTNRFRFTYEFE